MTLQVELVGSDGIILASDTCVTSFEDQLRGHSHIDKLYCTTQVACCWSGNESAMIAAKSIADTDWSAIADKDSELRGCATMACKIAFGDTSVPLNRISQKEPGIGYFPGWIVGGGVPFPNPFR